MSEDMVAQWGTYKYFNKQEFDCKHTGLNQMNHRFMLKLDKLREACGFPLVITSGYRDVSHPREQNKKAPGAHTKGLACDIEASRITAYIVLREALNLGFTGIGVNQKGDGRFIHLDMDEPIRVWSY
jgi:uncharacterized protein YcbK (DUF882 family)